MFVYTMVCLWCKQCGRLFVVIVPCIYLLIFKLQTLVDAVQLPITIAHRCLCFECHIHWWKTSTSKRRTFVTYEWMYAIVCCLKMDCRCRLDTFVHCAHIEVSPGNVLALMRTSSFRLNFTRFLVHFSQLFVAYYILCRTSNMIFWCIDLSFSSFLAGCQFFSFFVFEHSISLSDYLIFVRSLRCFERQLHKYMTPLWINHAHSVEKPILKLLVYGLNIFARIWTQLKYINRKRKKTSQTDFRTHRNALYIYTNFHTSFSRIN